MKNYFRDLIKSKAVAANTRENLITHKWIGTDGEGFSLGVGISDFNLWDTTTFEFLVNGVPVLDYGEIVDRIGSIDLMTPVKIDLPAHCVIEVYVTNNDPASSGLFAARLQCRTFSN